MMMPGCKNDRFTTAFGSMVIESAMVIGPNTIAPGPMRTPAPIVGASESFPAVVPILTQVPIRHPGPIRADELTTIVPLSTIASPGPKTCGGIVNPRRTDARWNRR